MTEKRIHTKSKITEDEMRRHISGEAIAKKYEDGGIEAVTKYIDSVEYKTHFSDCWAESLMKLLIGGVEERKQFDKEVKEGFEHMVNLEHTQFMLKGNLHSESDTELVSYIQANLQIIEKKLKWYYV